MGPRCVHGGGTVFLLVVVECRLCLDLRTGRRVYGNGQTEGNPDYELIG